MLSDICLTSVAYIGPKSRTERPRKIKIGIEVDDVTCDLDTTFKVKRSKVKVTGAYCGGLPHSLFNLVGLPVQSGKITVGLALQWPCVTDNSGITTYGLTAYVRQHPPTLQLKHGHFTFTLLRLLEGKGVTPFCITQCTHNVIYT